MTASTFLAVALPFTLGEEGGYVNDAQDRGGPTNMGVTLASWQAWAHDPSAGISTIRALTPARVRPFYATRWQAGGCDALPAGVDLSVFDMGVTSGLMPAGMQIQRVIGLAGTACDGWVGPRTVAMLADVSGSSLALRLLPSGVRALQAGLGLVVDGQAGPVTLDAARAHPAAVVCAALGDQQAMYYRSLAGFPTFGAGWLARVQRRAVAAMRLATGRGELQAPIS